MRIVCKAGTMLLGCAILGLSQCASAQILENFDGIRGSYSAATSLNGVNDWVNVFGDATTTGAGGGLGGGLGGDLSTTNADVAYLGFAALPLVLQEIGSSPMTSGSLTWRVAANRDANNNGWIQIGLDAFISAGQQFRVEISSGGVEMGGGEVTDSFDNTLPTVGWLEWRFTLDKDNDALSTWVRDIDDSNGVPIGPWIAHSGNPTAVTSTFDPIGFWFRSGATSATPVFDNLALGQGNDVVDITLEAITISDVAALQFQTSNGVNYQLQFNAGLPTGLWENTPYLILGDGTVLPAYDPTGVDTNTKSYRVVVP